MIVGEYKYLKFPFVSKSSYLSAVFGCPYKFNQAYLLGRKTLANDSMIAGTSLHHYYDTFFDNIEYNALWDMDWVNNHDTPYSEVYNYFVSLLQSNLPEKIINLHLLRNIKCFARAEENHWYEIRAKYSNKKDVMLYFIPMAREKFYVNKKWGVFGTRDRDIKEPNKVMILDYKTGNTPKRANEVGKNGLYTTYMSKYKVAEGNFYSMLWLLENGYDFKFNTYNSKGERKWICVKDGSEVKINFLDYGFMYTNNKRAVVSRKKANIVSIRKILNNLDIIRDTNKSYNRDPNIYRCKRCDLFLSDCKDVLNYEIYGNV